MNNLPTSKGKCKNSILFLAFLLIYCLGISSLSAQNLKESSITLKVRNESVEKVFNQLTELTNFKFFYDQEVISKVPQVSLDVYDATLTQVLDKITSQTKLYFNRVNNTIEQEGHSRRQNKKITYSPKSIAEKEHSEKHAEKTSECWSCFESVVSIHDKTEYNSNGKSA